MKISTRGRYALILMLDLANHNRGVPVPLKETAKRQQISEKYLEQIISVLNKAGFVKSVRGPQGGYLLKKTGGIHGGNDPAADGGGFNVPFFGHLQRNGKGFCDQPCLGQNGKSGQ